jgi:hypothetical protein
VSVASEGTLARLAERIAVVGRLAVEGGLAVIRRLAVIKKFAVRFAIVEI